LGKNARHAAIALLVTLGSVATPSAGPLRISSPSFAQDGVMPPELTCDGAGVNPELRFDGVPAGAKSLVVIAVDPDVPRSIKSDGRFLHWALWDLPPDTGRIAVGQRLRGLNESGPGGYVAACPPNGEHRYVFQLYALDTLIGNARISNEADLRRAMEGHVLDQAELVGRYTIRLFRIVRVVLPAIVLLIVIAVAYRVMARRRSSAAPKPLTPNL
jgi:Raf kinase inhibitor-like YbhB/YbcL family protein